MANHEISVQVATIALIALFAYIPWIVAYFRRHAARSKLFIFCSTLLGIQSIYNYGQIILHGERYFLLYHDATSDIFFASWLVLLAWAIIGAKVPLGHSSHSTQTRGVS